MRIVRDLVEPNSKTRIRIVPDGVSLASARKCLHFGVYTMGYWLRLAYAKHSIDCETGKMRYTSWDFYVFWTA